VPLQSTVHAIFSFSSLLPLLREDASTGAERKVATISSEELLLVAREKDGE